MDTTWFQDTFGLRTLDKTTITGLIYLQVSITNLGAVFVTRSQTFFFLERPGNFVIGAFVVAQIIASVLGAYGLNGYTGFYGSGWGYVLVAWIWSIVWFVFLDVIKIVVRKIFRAEISPFYHKEAATQSVHPYPQKGHRFHLSHLFHHKRAVPAPSITTV